MTRAISQGAFAVVAKKGDRDSGTVALTVRKRDLWVVEIDDRDGRHFLTEPVVSAVEI